MLLELWETLSGRRNWIETQARIISAKTTGNAKVVRGRSGPKTIHNFSSTKKLQWQDQTGANRDGEMNVDMNSPAFELGRGESLTIRYNPGSPMEFYARTQQRHRTNRAVKIALRALVGLGIFLGGFIYDLLRKMKL